MCEGEQEELQNWDLIVSAKSITRVPGGGEGGKATGGDTYKFVCPAMHASKYSGVDQRKQMSSQGVSDGVSAHGAT